MEPTAPPNQPPADWRESLRHALIWVRRLGPVGVVAAISSILPPIGLVLLATNLRAIGDWLHAGVPNGLWIYIGGFATLSGLAVLPSHAPSFLGGWTFGWRVGIPAAIAGMLGAAIIGYLIGAFTARDRVVRLIAEQPRWQAVFDALMSRSFGRTLLIIFLIRLTSSPFSLTNIVLAATRVRFGLYLLGTILGLAPRCAVVAALGAGSETLDFGRAKSWWLMAAGLVAVLIVMKVIATIATRALEEVAASDQPGNTKSDPPQSEPHQSEPRP